MRSMMAPSRRDRAWSLGVLAIAVLVVAVLTFALLRALIGAVDGGGENSASASSATPSGTAAGAPTRRGGQTQEDALADAAMLQLPESAAFPQPLVSAAAGPPITVPPPQITLVAGGPPVPTGFPRTPEGALAQLAAIDQVAMSTLDVTRIHEIYVWAAMPGAVPEADWNPSVVATTYLKELGDLLETGNVHTEFKAVQGQIKGNVGPDFAVVCVLGELTITDGQVDSQHGLGDCQRMAWSDNRWHIAAGSQPALAPQAWPGSADAVRGGWLPIVVNR